MFRLTAIEYSGLQNLKKLLNGFVNTFSLETYIAENINRDIYLSVDTNMTKVVKVICPNGDHRFTYEGKEGVFITGDMYQ